MKKILINGNFLCRNLTGIERFSFELCFNLDSILQADDDVSILVPQNAKKIPVYRNIKIVHSKKSIKSFPLWDMMIFPRECRRLKATALNFSNTAPLGKKCGISFIHDIYARDCPADFKTLKEKLIMIYSRFSYFNIVKNAEKIITVSEFSKNRILKKYHADESKIFVVPNGWDHFKKIKSDESVFEKFPSLKKNEFYFTLGSLSRRKNLKWILNYAEKNPGERFAVSGKAISGLVPDELKNLQKMENVVLLGYVTDGEVKSLMENCRAFVFPSYYEGFGIPPLEALSSGAKIVVAAESSLPEIYGKTARYIDLKKDDTNLNELLQEETESPQKILEKFTYRNSAEKLKRILEN